MIEVEGLTKRYRDLLAVDDIAFEIKPGEVVGFLGPNGAGKSTTMKILTCSLAPSAGSAQVAGHDVVAIDAQIRLARLLTNRGDMEQARWELRRTEATLARIGDDPFSMFDYTPVGVVVAVAGVSFGVSCVLRVACDTNSTALINGDDHENES